MKYNPQIHHRRSIRLQGYDYAQAGAYFITICCEKREYRFGKIEHDKMILNEYGTVAYDEWIKLPVRFSNCDLDVLQIMPNHIHGIMILKDTVGEGFTPAPKEQKETIDDRATARVAPTNGRIGDIIGAYKSLVSKTCLEIFKSKNTTMGKLWQRNYYEHIIRNEQSYQIVAEYIMNNPAKWQEDKLYIQ